jgi:hypothetical protein
MSEPKVVHEWEWKKGYRVRFVESGEYILPQVQREETEWVFADLPAGVIPTELARLAARVQELEEQIRGYGHVWWTKDQQVEIDELNAENTRLREALEKIRALGPYEMQEMADEALKEKP